MYNVHVDAQVSTRVLENAHVVCACERAGAHVGAQVGAQVGTPVHTPVRSPVRLSHLTCTHVRSLAHSHVHFHLLTFKPIKLDHI